MRSLPCLPTLLLLATTVNAVSLDDLRWQRRLVIAHGGDARERAAFESLVAEEACRLADRDIDVYLVGESEVRPLSAAAAPLDSGAAAALAALADRSGGGDAHADGLGLTLIGKDGGVKRRADGAAALADFFEAVDGMPMRRAEMDRRDDPC